MKASDLLLWGQCVESVQKSKDQGFKELFRGKIRGSFLINIKGQILKTFGTDIMKYYDFRWTNENMLTGKDDLPEYDICRFIVGIHCSHSIFLADDEVKKSERDAKYREYLVCEVMEKMKLHRYGSFFFRKKTMIQGKEFLYYPVPYDLFVLCVKAHELFGRRKDIVKEACWPLYYGIMSNGLAALSLMADNFLGSAYPLCRGVLEMYFKLLVIKDDYNAADHYGMFTRFELEQSCCTQKYPKEFNNLLKRRMKHETCSKVTYLHYGWLDWVKGYHESVKQAPYSMNGIITYLKNGADGKEREDLDRMEYFYKMCHGYTHGSVQKAIYPELHYFEISIMLYYTIRNTFVMLCGEQDEGTVINGLDVIAMVDKDIVELLGQYDKRSTENFELQRKRLRE